MITYALGVEHEDISRAANHSIRNLGIKAHKLADILEEDTVIKSKT